MPNFSRVISLAYMRLLERPPDPGGLASYNEAMNQGMTEAMMRESLIRSPEYAAKNPDVALAASRTAPRTRKAASRRKKPSRRR
jgi:uncharacterized protein DUF4214